MSEDTHTSEDNLAPSHPSLKCSICQGPIGTGEPVSYGEGYITHRFTSDCNWHKDPEMLRKQDEEFLRDLGVTELKEAEHED